MKAGKLILGMMLAVSAAVPVADTASAAVTVRRVGPANSTLLDMTPSGRYVLVRVSSFTSFHYERIDTQTNQRVRLPAGNWSQITSGGTAVVGVDARSQHTVLRTRVGSGRTRRVRLPDTFDWSGTVSSIDATARKVGVTATSGQCGCSAGFIVNLETGTVKRLAGLVPGGARSVGPVVLSADGSVAVFNASTTSGAVGDVYRYSAATGRVSLAVTNRFGRRPSGGFTILGDLSANGRIIVFYSTATNLVRGVRTSAPRYYARNLSTKRTWLLPFRPSEHSDLLPVIDHDGSRIAYVYDGRVAGSPAPIEWPLVGRYDRATGTATPMMGTLPPPAQLTHLRALAIDASGGRVAFASTWSLVPGRPCNSLDFPCTYLATA